MKSNRIFSLIVVLILMMSINPIIESQEQAVPVECGTILEDEFTARFQVNRYTIDLQPRDIIKITADHLVKNVNLMARLLDPAEAQLVRNDSGVINEFQVGATGTHIIEVHEGNGIGLYTLSIGCIIYSTGEVIEPGAAPPVRINSPSGGSDLAPTTIEGAAVIPLTSGLAMSGAIGAEGIPPYTYTLNAIGGNTLTLQVDRISGNLNLGIVVVSPDNQVLFYGGLIASNTLSTTLTLPIDSQPAEGQYTISVFRVDLLPPAVPEATAFQVLGTLNP